MKNKFLLLTPIFLVALVTSCGEKTPTTSSSESSSSGTTQTSTSQSSSESSSSTSSGSSTSTSTSSSTSTSGGNDPIPPSGQMLPIGNTTVSGPHNLTRVSVDDYTDFSFHSSLPSDWEYIQGNNKIKNCSDFYDNEKGGFRFSHLHYGFQSPLLKTYKKLEVRLYISQINNSSKSADKTKDIFHYYCYNSSGQYTYYETQANETITSSTVGNYVRFYITQSECPDFSYFEVRLNYFASKGSQCYNFGIEKIQLKGWDYE